MDKLDFGYYNMDCMAGMKLFPDKYFDVAIVDPPYGINAPNMAMGTNKSRTKNGYPAESTASRLKRSGQVKEWDSKPPTEEYFKELFRVSKNQIIWGGTNSEKRIHPTQKPIALYEYLVGAFKLSGGVVLDTHVGSASSLIAYHRTGVRFVGFEIDTEMYEVSNARLEREKAQLSLFDLGMERNGDE